MVIFIVLVLLFFYYWFFVVYSEKIDKPKNISNKYVDLDGNMYQNDRIINKIDSQWNYNTQNVMNPFDYNISLQNNNLQFSSLGKIWNVQLTSDFFWNGNQIAEKDDCFGKTGMVAAKGKHLYDYIRHHDLLDDTSNSVNNEIYQNINLFYFKCKDEKIDSLHKCPPGHVFEGTNCKFIDTCRDKPDFYTYMYPQNKFKYYECQQGTSVEKQCPPKQIFQYNACKTPDNICEVEKEGHRIALTKYTYGECTRGKMEIHSCITGYHFFDGKCEYEKCHGKHNEYVPYYDIKNGPFSFSIYYSSCEHGKLKKTFRCPSKWNTFNTDVNITHLPKVFENGGCVEPVLCKNVKLIDPDAVIPAYNYSKHLATWNMSALFDGAYGFNCNSNDEMQTVDIPEGSLVTGFKIKNACTPTMTKIPINRPDAYFDCADNIVKTCQPNSFFNGSICKEKNPKAFNFNNHLDVFEFNSLGENNWMKARFPKAVFYKPNCNAGEVYIKEKNVCIHPECKRFMFISELRKPIKLDNEYQCVWDVTRHISKEKYDNPDNLQLHFWKQTLGDNSMDDCTVGNKLMTGNFVLDSTVYTTCKDNQPFVFCPSNATTGIVPVTNDIYACKPKDEVYTQVLKQDESHSFYPNEVDYILIPKGARYRLSKNSRATANVETRLSIPSATTKFTFTCNMPTNLYYKSLVNNPPNTYILNRQIHETTNFDKHYNIVDDKETDQFLEYTAYPHIKRFIPNFEF